MDPAIAKTILLIVGIAIMIALVCAYHDIKSHKAKSTAEASAARVKAMENSFKAGAITPNDLRNLRSNALFEEGGYVPHTKWREHVFGVVMPGSTYEHDKELARLRAVAETRAKIVTMFDKLDELPFPVYVPQGPCVDVEDKDAIDTINSTGKAGRVFDDEREWPSAVGPSAWSTLEAMESPPKIHGRNPTSALVDEFESLETSEREAKG